LVSQLISAIVSACYFNVIEDPLSSVVMGAGKVTEDVELFKNVTPQ
jgi:hypothetical protein